MIDLNDPLVIEFLRGAGWVKIDDNDVVIERAILSSLIFDAAIDAVIDKGPRTINLTEK
jgi:hypothetical protein